MDTYTRGIDRFEVRAEVVNYIPKGNRTERNIRRLGSFQDEYMALVFSNALAIIHDYKPMILFNNKYIAMYVCKTDPTRFITVSRPGVGIPETLEEEISNVKVFFDKVLSEEEAKAVMNETLEEDVERRR